MVLMAGLSGGAPAADDLETYMSTEEWNLMDPFEAHVLSQADKRFAAKEYKLAEVEYESFILEYPKSKAIPYALMRKGRTRQLVDKRFEAIKIYEEVLDYFRDNINVAAASLYYIGECRQQNGSPVEAMKAFTKMAQDKDYRQHRLAALAILSLADYLVKQDKAEDAVKFYEQAALDFRTRMRTSAFEAIRRALYHHIRRAPNAKRVRELYVKVKGFDQDQIPANEVTAVEKLMTDRRFADQTRRYIREYGGFDPKAVAQRRDYYRYWGNVFENKFPDWDDFQIEIFGWLEDKWMERVDAQFRRVKPDFDRIVWWKTLLGAGPPEEGGRILPAHRFSQDGQRAVLCADGDAVRQLRPGPDGAERVRQVQFSEDGGG